MGLSAPNFATALRLHCPRLAGLVLFAWGTVVGCGANSAVGGEAPVDGGDGDGSGADTSRGSGATTGDGALPSSRPECADVAPEDTSAATTFVGEGTPDSCTEEALTNAVARGGTVRFRCGEAPHTLLLRQEIRVTKSVTLDGEGRIVLDGGGATRILHLASSFERSDVSLTLQGLTFKGGRTTDVPNTKKTESGGGAVYRLGGTLKIVDCRFEGNRGPDTGQDVAGGAVYGVGAGPTLISRSVFVDNGASNGGAVGVLGGPLVLENSTFVSNRATGSGGNPGNGGNGGAVSIDGRGKRIRVCNVHFSENRANAFGGALFRVSYEGEPTELTAVRFARNAVPDAPPSMAGALYLQGTSITLREGLFFGNEARAAGAAFFGPGASLDAESVYFARNVALSSLGGALSVDRAVRGSLSHATFFGNRAPGTVAFAGAIAGGEGLTLRSSVFAANEAGNGYNPISCTKRMAGEGTSFQWPVKRTGAGSDDPGALCATGVRAEDPLLVATKEGDIDVARPDPSSPALRVSTTCPARDPLGAPRTSPCSAGAFDGRP